MKIFISLFSIFLLFSCAKTPEKIEGISLINQNDRIYIGKFIFSHIKEVVGASSNIDFTIEEWDFFTLQIVDSELNNVRVIRDITSGLYCSPSTQDKEDIYLVFAQIKEFEGKETYYIANLCIKLSDENLKKTIGAYYSDH